MKTFLSKQKYQIYFITACAFYFIGRAIVSQLFNI